MKTKIIPFTLFLLCFVFCNASIDSINVRIFSDLSISNVKIEPHTGTYVIAADNEEFLLPSSGNVELSVRNSRIQIRIAGRDKGAFRNVSLSTKDSLGILKFIPNRNINSRREYEGNFVFSATGTFIQIVNNMEMERYIAAVVQAEIYGRPDQLDIFKVQSVISRTWVLKNMQKHKNDGYNVCDGVHCQAYKNRCLRKEIFQATQETHEEVMIDGSGNLIETAFHSNSGGQTVNSEDFWQSPLPYLRSIVDTFSYKMAKSVWERKIPKNDWLNYFKNTHKLDINNNEIAETLLNFQQEQRKTRIHTVSLRSVREDLKLMSTFFSVTEDGNDVRLSGKGFGHGVGLSQEGAIRMVELGYPYQEILTFYYTDAKLRKPDGVYESTIIKEPVIADVSPTVTPKKELVTEEVPEKKEEDKKPSNKERKKRTAKKDTEKSPVVYPEEEAEFEIIID